MADLDAQIRALEEQVARENQQIELARQQQQQPAAPVPALGAPPAWGAPVQPVTHEIAVGADGSKAAPRFAPDADDRSVFVNNLPKREDVTPEAVTAFFADCGQILKCTLLRVRPTNEFKGSAYIEFATHEGAGRAIDTKNNAAFGGQAISVTKKRSLFNPARGGHRGRGRGGNPQMAMEALAAIFAGATRGFGRGRGRGRGAPRGGGAPAPGQPFQ